ncbi:MAG: DUF1616 domain-containing protein [Anaerolineae bacterium]
MRLSIRGELLVVAAVFGGLLVLVPLSELGIGLFVLLRVALSMVGLFVIPGYFWQVALFPRIDTLPNWGRAALCIGLSAASVPFLTLILDGILYVPMVLTSVLVGILIWTLIGALMAWWRRHRLAPEDRYSVRVPLEQVRPIAAHDRLGTLLVALLVLAAGLFGAALVATYAVPGPAHRYSEFYVLGPDGNAEDYPRTLQTGIATTLLLTVSNHEGNSHRYMITAHIGGSTVGESESLSLDDGASATISLNITPTVAGDNQPIDVILRREGDAGPYRTLRLWADITSGASAQTP